MNGTPNLTNPATFYFDWVANKYNKTKPINGAVHRIEHDIRPIGPRRYTHERIKKVSDTCYALLDGFYCSMTASYFNNPSDMEKYQNNMAPIMVERKPDGDYIHIRNGSINTVLTTRYNFITTWAPRGLDFVIDNGKHFVKHDDVRYYLPKTPYGYDWNAKTFRNEHDHKYLTFKALPNNKWERVSSEHDMPVKRVDRDAKKELKPAIDAYYTWMITMLPLIDTSYSARGDYIGALMEANKEFCYVGNSWINTSSLAGISPKLLRNIITDEEHELRIALAANLDYVVGVKYNLVGDGVPQEEHADKIKRIRSRYNTVMNKLLDLYQTVKS